MLKLPLVLTLGLLLGPTLVLSSQLILNDDPASVEDNFSNRVFNSVWGFLRSIHQSQHPNGRAIVPGVVKKGTLLYHGRPAGPPAKGIDWFAFDAEHSYMFASHGEQGGTLWTYTATRDLKVLYFDGFSASKGRDGGLESQNVLAGLEFDSFTAPPEGPGRRPGGGMGDGERAERLCNMYQQHGIHGFIRQEATYELMFCDFEKDVVPVASTNITLPSANPFPQPPPTGDFPPPDDEPQPPPRGPRGPRGADNFAAAQNHYSFARAASWHHQIADTRVTLFPEYSTTLYDSKYTSLRETAKQPVLDQRLSSLSADDLTEFKSEIGRALHSWANHESSGSDWRSIFMAVADRFDTSLAETRAELDAYSPRDNVTRLAERVRALTYGMLMPYLDARSTLNETAIGDPAYDSTRQTSLHHAKKQCQTAFSGHLSDLNEQEIRLKDSLESVLGRICSFTVDTFAQATAVQTVVQEDVAAWQAEITTLMNWLAWPSWVRLQRLCSRMELPYMPMWPLGEGPGVREDAPGLTCIDASF